MSNQRQRKEKIKAKQQADRLSADGLGVQERQTAGLSEVVQKRSANDDSKNAQQAMNAALAAEKRGKELDPRLVQLFTDFKRYRAFIIAGVVLGFVIVLAAMGLYKAGTIDEDMQTNIIIFGNVELVAVMAIAFGRVRPIKEDINAWNKVNQIALSESGGKHGATQADIDKIFWARERNKRVPPTPEFKKIRSVWLVLVAIGSALLLAAVIMASKNIGDITIPMILVFVSMAVLIVAAYIERKKMKPLREEWKNEFDKKVKAATKASKRKGRN